MYLLPLLSQTAQTRRPSSPHSINTPLAIRLLSVTCINCKHGNLFLQGRREWDQIILRSNQFYIPSPANGRILTHCISYLIGIISVRLVLHVWTWSAVQVSFSFHFHVWLQSIKDRNGDIQLKQTNLDYWGLNACDYIILSKMSWIQITCKVWYYDINLIFRELYRCCVMIPVTLMGLKRSNHSQQKNKSVWGDGYENDYRDEKLFTSPFLMM